jgi:hypothetical protein
MPVNSAEVLQLFFQINRLSRLLEPHNGDARWEYLQKWLEENPKYSKQVNHCMRLSPKDAVEYLTAEFNLDLDLITLFDPERKQLAKVEKLIETIQTLYKERKEQEKLYA